MEKATIKGIDIGFNSTKVYNGSLRIFESVESPLFQIRYGLSEVNGKSYRFVEPECVIGNAALRFGNAIRRYDDNWVESETWYRCFLAAAVGDGHPPEEVVVGLPVENFQELKGIVKARLEKYHYYQLEGSERQGFLLSRVGVTMQPFGTLVHLALDDSGKERDPVYANGNIGIIDIGGKTTNLLRAVELVEIPQETVSFPVGGWQAVSFLKSRLKEEYPELSLPDHVLDQALRTRKIRYNGREQKIGGIVDDAIQTTSNQIHAAMSQVWDLDKMASFDKIVLTGGGALLFGKTLQSFLSRAEMVNDPVEANVRGYRKLALFG